MRKNLFSIVVLAMMLVFAAPSHAYFPIDISGSSYETQSSDTVRVRHIIVPGLPDKVWADFRWDPNLFVFVFVNFGIEVKPPPPPNPVIAKLELLKGHWRFIYTIQTTWTDEYLLTTILESPTNPGTFFIGGFNQYGGTVVAMYDKDKIPSMPYALLDPGPSFDQFYTFDTNGKTILRGCYYMIIGSTISRCYSLSGSKIGELTLQNFDLPKKDKYDHISVQKEQIEQASELCFGDDEMMKLYLKLKFMDVMLKQELNEK